MKYYKLLFIVSFIASLGILTYRVTHGLFSDTASSTSNTFTASAEFPTTPPSITPTEAVTPTVTITPTPTGSQNIVINEVFEDSQSEDEWVELFNNTSGPIDVSGWTVNDNSDADIFPSVSPIPAGGYAIVVPVSSTATVPASAVKIQLIDAIGGGLAQGGDKLELKNLSSTTIDALSWGSNHDIFSSPALGAPSNNKTLARDPNGFDTDSATDWITNADPSIGVANP